MNSSPIFAGSLTVNNLNPLNMRTAQPTEAITRNPGAMPEDVVALTSQNADNALAMLGNTNIQQQALSVHRGLDASRVNELLNFDF